MKLLTLNMHKGFSALNRRFILHELREAIRASQADVVFLQEVLGDHREHSTRYEEWPDGSQYEFLADTIWSSFAYGKNAVYPEGHHGNALLSKYPILRHANHDVSTRKAERRGLLHAVIHPPEEPRPMHLVCVHLGLTGGQRREQIRLLCELLARETDPEDPVIVAGDFNDWRQQAHDPLAAGAGLREVFIEAYGRAARTFLVRRPLLKLDRVYLRNLQVEQAEVLSGHPWRDLSDHAALSWHVHSHASRRN